MERKLAHKSSSAPGSSMGIKISPSSFGNTGSASGPKMIAKTILTVDTERNLENALVDKGYDLEGSHTLIDQKIYFCGEDTLVTSIKARRKKSKSSPKYIKDPIAINLGSLFHHDLCRSKLSFIESH